MSLWTRGAGGCSDWVTMDVVDLDRLIEGELYARGDLTLPRMLDLCRAYPAQGEELLAFFWAWVALGPVGDWGNDRGKPLRF